MKMQNFPRHHNDTPHKNGTICLATRPSRRLFQRVCLLPSPPFHIKDFLDSNQHLGLYFFYHLLLSLGKINVAELLHHGGCGLLPLALRLFLLEILFRVVEVFIRRHAKNTAILKLAS